MIHGHSRRASRSSLGRAAIADGLNLGGANLTILNGAEGLTQMLASVVPPVKGVPDSPATLAANGMPSTPATFAAAVSWGFAAASRTTTLPARGATTPHRLVTQDIRAPFTVSWSQRLGIDSQ